MPSSCRLHRRENGFTLLELLITLSMVLVIFVTLAQFVDDTGKAWKSAAADPFAPAQDAFQTVAQNLASATLEQYQDYADNTGAFRSGSGFEPDHLARRSDLDFVCGPSSRPNGLLTATGRMTSGDGVFFLAPQGYTQSYAHEGMERLLNAEGYFVEFSDDTSAPSFAQSHFWRWRLKQVVQPAESLQIFTTTDSATWINDVVTPQTTSSALADNVISLIVLPERAVGDSGPALSTAFSYDSRDTTNKLTLNQLPPRVHLALVAIDELSAERLAVLDGSSPPQLVPANLFQQSAQLSGDLAALDASLTALQIGHRIYQRDILMTASNWSNTPSP
jgi:uncharacterized protein (TIGR02599 family)